jgi:hypothetical protein
MLLKDYSSGRHLEVMIPDFNTILTESKGEKNASRKTH